MIDLSRPPRDPPLLLLPSHNSRRHVTVVRTSNIRLATLVSAETRHGAPPAATRERRRSDGGGGGEARIGDGQGRRRRGVRDPGRVDAPVDAAGGEGGLDRAPGRAGRSPEEEEGGEAGRRRRGGGTRCAGQRVQAEHRGDGQCRAVRPGGPRQADLQALCVFPPVPLAGTIVVD